jgi:hypothetical protein
MITTVVQARIMVIPTPSTSSFSDIDDCSVYQWTLDLPTRAARYSIFGTSEEFGNATGGAGSITWSWRVVRLRTCKLVIVYKLNRHISSCPCYSKLT